MNDIVFWAICVFAICALVYFASRP